MPTTRPYLEFHARLLCKCEDFFTRYTKKGGNPDNVIALLWYLTPESKKARIPKPQYPALAQDFKKKLIQLEGTCAGLLPYFPKNPTSSIRKLKKTVGATQEASRQVRRSDAAMRNFLKAHGFHGKRGWRGPLEETVILKVLEQELRERLRRPHYKEMLALAETATGTSVLRLQSGSSRGKDDPAELLRVRLHKVDWPAEYEATYRKFFPPEP
ncbi:MAG: hypothetical protein HYY11_01860 [Candidatus Methylomirabilis oxyfera]|nr:hypothetical protein [Candidatus Methylomirabilis oxyfera]